MVQTRHHARSLWQCDLVGSNYDDAACPGFLLQHSFTMYRFSFSFAF